MMGYTKTTNKEGPNVLAVGILLLLLGLSAVSSAVDGPATIIVLATALGFFAIMWMVTIGWGDSRILARRAGPRPERRTPRALPRGRVVAAPRRSRSTPTV